MTVSIATDLRGRRYGEVLLVMADPGGPKATVYNTFPLNDCPAELWSKLDADAIATENGAAAALLNGPRYWLMDSIEKTDPPAAEQKTFGGIDMLRQATVELTSMKPAPYLANTVTRNAVFVFDAGSQIYELTDPDGGHWVMQTYSQVVDPALSLEDLPGLEARLALPDGWSFTARTLPEQMRVDTSSESAAVLQDDLTNSYSRLV